MVQGARGQGHGWIDEWLRDAATGSIKVEKEKGAVVAVVDVRNNDWSADGSARPVRNPGRTLRRKEVTRAERGGHIVIKQAAVKLVAAGLRYHRHLPNGARIRLIVSAIDTRFLEALDIVRQRADLRSVGGHVADAI